MLGQRRAHLSRKNRIIVAGRVQPLHVCTVVHIQTSGSPYSKQPPMTTKAMGVKLQNNEYVQNDKTIRARIQQQLNVHTHTSWEICYTSPLETTVVVTKTGSSDKTRTQIGLKITCNHSQTSAHRCRKQIANSFWSPNSCTCSNACNIGDNHHLKYHHITKQVTGQRTPQST